MLKINNLSVKLKGTNKKIIDGLSLDIADGEVHAIMGPNGIGKSTLSKTITGYYKFEITAGEILLNDEVINNLSVDERAKRGVFLAMQDPVEIDGVTTSEFLKTALGEVTGEKVSYYELINTINSAIADLDYSKDMIHRHLNKGFSGGEKKKNEILQLKVLKPNFIILDEIDSGLDVDSLKIVCDNINKYLKDNPKTSILIITHYPRILEYIKPDYVHIMNHGKIEKTGDLNLALQTEKDGYGK